MILRSAVDKPRFILYAIINLIVYSKSIGLEEKMYTIHEVCERTGLTAHTLRYYEREKLLPGVGRSPGGFRQYSEEDMEALSAICCLKNTGMSLQDIARFMELIREGDHTLRDRYELLKRHRETVIERMAQMQKHLDKVTCKVNCYARRLEAFERSGENEDDIQQAGVAPAAGEPTAPE